MTQPTPQIAPLGEAAITITLSDRIDEAVHGCVLALADAIRQARLEGVEEVVPAYTTVTVYYNPLHLDYDVLVNRLLPWCARTDSAPAPATRRDPIRIPVRYDGQDLAAVAQTVGLTPDEVVRRHAAPTYRAYVIGFVPGFAYLGNLDPTLALPRRSAPRTRVPAGSVAIADAQTAVYPFGTPGGWHLIGHTDAKLFDPNRSPSALLRVGDLVRFDPQ